MNFNLIILATILVTLIGLFVGVFLGVSAIKFEVPVDEREVLVREALPGANCGACGYPGCDGFAHAVVEGVAPVTGCPVGGASCSTQLGEIMGVSSAFEKVVAFVRCGGTCTNTKDKFTYSGIMDCNAATVVPGATHKQCSFGCLGLGSCVRACEYDAIHILQDIAKVNEEKCVACKACVYACPKDLIDIIPYSATQVVRCMSKDKAKEVKVSCEVGCIACKKCEKACEYDAVHVKDNLASIEYDKCTRCGKCAEACPQDTITFTMRDEKLFINTSDVEIKEAV